MAGRPSGKAQRITGPLRRCFFQSEFTAADFLPRKRIERGLRVCGAVCLRRHIWLLHARGKYVMVRRCSVVFPDSCYISYCTILCSPPRRHPPFQFITLRNETRRWLQLDEKQRKYPWTGPLVNYFVPPLRSCPSRIFDSRPPTDFTAGNRVYRAPRKRSTRNVSQQRVAVI